PGSGWASTGGVSQALPNVGSLPISGLTSMVNAGNLKDYFNRLGEQLKSSQSTDVEELFKKMGKKS
ncbi:hypothetical protein, partial [Serratia sp. 2723]|uniref:hypothetical protein n=1 Tax=unclassified Serratia (in: enterobacteria) TaxID=2647522 RepID=UPI003D246B0B